MHNHYKLRLALTLTLTLTDTGGAVLTLRIIEPSDYRNFGLSNLGTIEQPLIW